MNKFLQSFFSHQLAQIIQKGKYVDVRVAPRNLLKELKDKKEQQFLIRYLKSTSTEQTYLRVLSIIGILLLNSDDYYELIYENLTQIQCPQTWISQQILRPFSKWVKKCCQTSLLFKEVKRIVLDNSTVMDRVPYSIKLLKELMDVIKSIPKFGRYYNLKEGHKEYTMLSEILLTLNNTIYSHIKNSLEYFLYNEKQQKINLHREVIRWIYNQIIPEVNQQIKYVTLCKHFRFYQKGIVVKMISIDQYHIKVQHLLNQLLNLRQKSKSTQLQQLKSQIFPDDGSFNEDLFFSTLEDSSMKADRHYSIRNLFTENVSEIKTRVITLKKYRKRHF